jgi:hypothetical protein
MGIVKLREYIGAPAPRQVDPSLYPVPEENSGQVARLFEYLYGDERGRGRVITDSRQLRTLSRILSDDSGNGERILRRERDLQAALDATVSHQIGARRELLKAVQALRQANDHIQQNGFSASVLAPLVDDCQRALVALETAIRRIKS